MPKKENSITPLVSDAKSVASMFEFLEFFEEFSCLPELSDYYLNDDTRKNQYDDFVTAIELKRLLTPHARLINRPDICRWRIFYFFYMSISPEKTREMNESHLAKVIVLLQLLANPDLAMSENKVPRSDWFLLQNNFKHGQFGLNVLNLLFSYGLSYERFLEELQFSVQSKNKIHCINIGTTLQSFENFLNNASPEEKNTLSVSCEIYEPIFHIQRNNNHMLAYQFLRNAYSAYQGKDYSTAHDYYEAASTAFDTLNSNETELSALIKNDYMSRHGKCIEYAQICSDLEKSQSVISSLLKFNYFSTTDSEQQNRRPLLQKKLKIS